jgi:hypothetical protein
MNKGLDAVPVILQPIESTALPIPISDSVRAATWDSLADKPLQPRHIKVACIVTATFGVPGSCVPASDVAPGSKAVDWAKLRNDNDAWIRIATPEEVALLRIVTERLQTARAPSQTKPKSMFVIRFFDEIISPADARPPFEAKEALTMNDVTFAKPIDGNVLSKLYPVLALRNSATARVSMSCEIEPNLKLLCRDSGDIELRTIGETETRDISQAFRFATYQFASTLQLAPQDKSGKSIVGRQLKFAISWQIPS